MGKIIWLASYPKSGNTWLRVFLHNLLRNPDRPWDINKISKFSTGDSNTELYKPFDPRPATEYTVKDIARMRPLVQAALMQASRDNVFVKTHNALVEDHGYPAINLEVTAGTIYVVRSPLDVVISYANHMALPIDKMIEIMAEKGARTGINEIVVSEKTSSWSENVASWTATPHPTLLVVRYEDMHAEPIKTFGGVARFLGLKPPRERLDKAIKMSSFKVVQEQERRHGFFEKSPMSERFFRVGTSGQWRAILTPEQVAKIVADHREQMARFGYVPEDY
ncbi:MAG: sulfotransferase domain-containing protein [Alphaproteobacteria bacterium]